MSHHWMVSDRRAHAVRRSSLLALVTLLVSLFAPFASPASAASATLTAAVPTFDATSINAWQLNGSAQRSGNVLRLTPATAGQAGSAFFKNRASLANERSFSSYFVLSFSSSGNYPGFAAGADGIVFTMQTQSNTAGGSGSGIGYAGISPSVGIEFDTFNNTSFGIPEPDDHHVGLDVNGSVHSISIATAPGALKENTWNVWVDYNGLSDNLQVRMSQGLDRAAATLVMDYPIDIATYIGTDVYVGFTAATGSAWENHDVQKFYFNNDYISGGIDPVNNTYQQAPTSVAVGATPATIGNNNVTTSTITATVRGPDGLLMANQQVAFAATSGTLDSISGITDANGQASVTFRSTTAGTSTIRATAVGGYYAETTVSVVDVVPPSPPVIWLPAASSVIGTAAPAFSGTATADTTLVSVYDGATLLCTAVPGFTQNWNCQSSSSLADGLHTVSVTGRDAAENVSNVASRTFTIDTVLPSLPVIVEPTGLVPLNDPTPLFRGTAEPLIEVQVRNGLTVLCQTTADVAGDWSCTPSSELTSGTYLLNVRTADLAGNASITNLALTIDLLEPGQPQLTSPADGSSTNDSTPTFEGLTEADALVTVKHTGDDTVLCQTTAEPTGSWSCAPAQSLVDATYTVAVYATDAAGNQSQPANSSFTVDTVNPGEPTVDTPAASAIVASNKPQFGGTADAGSTVEVRDGALLLCSTTVTAGSTWSCASTEVLGQGAHTVSVTAEDAAGNQSSAASRSFVVDSVKPAPVQVDAPLEGGLLNDAAPLFSGLAEPLSAVEVYEGFDLVCWTIALEDGSWSCEAQPALADGAHTVAIVAKDSAQNMSIAVERTFTTDATAPGMATITTPADAAKVTDATPTFVGTAEPDSAVEVKQGSDLLCATTADGSGDWSCTPTTPLVDGSVTVGVWVRDAATNVSLEATRSFALDSTAPAQPVVQSPAAAAEVNDATPEFTGTAEPNSAVEIKDGATPICTTTADPNGDWSCTPLGDLLDGPHTLLVLVTDSFGNTSQAAALTIQIDTVQPDPAGQITPADGSATNDTTPPFAGTAEPDAAVEVKVGADTVCTTTADGTGDWSCTPSTALAPGDHTFTISVTDAAGNSATVTTDLTIDTAAPQAPVVTAPQDAADVNDATPEFTGTAEPGSTVDVYQGTTLLCTTTVAGSGDWSCAPKTDLGDGAASLTVVATDPAGNESAATPLALTIDTVAPQPPVLLAPANGALLNDATPEFNGTAEPGSTVEVRENGALLCSAVVDGSGNWSCTPTTPLGETPHALDIATIDPAGNPSTALTSTLSVDTIAPAAPAVGTPADGSATSDTTPSFAGTAEPNADITVRQGAAVLCTTQADGSGDWSCAPSTPLDAGPHAVEVTATDAAGNTTTANLTVTIDTAAPGSAVIAAPGADVNDATPEFSGTAEPGSTVDVYEGTTLLCSATADVNGDWSCAPASPLSESSHTASITVVDAAGNRSSAVDVTFVVDTTAPAQAVIAGPLAGAQSGDATPELSGTAEPDSTVEVYEGTTLLCSATADENGDWSCTPGTALGEGSHSIDVTVVDAAGNRTGGATLTFSVDTLAPVTPVVGDPADGSATNDPTPEFTGKAEPDTLIEVLEGTSVLCSAIVDPNGDWSCTPATPLAPGSHALTIVATDLAGNAGTPQSLTLTVDTTPPAQPVVGGPLDGAAVDDATPEFSGTAEPGSTVEVYEGTTLLCSATADQLGNWSCAPSTALGEGDHTLDVLVTDAAGNASASRSLTVTVDTVAPQPPVLIAPANGALLNDATPTFVGTAEPGSTIEVRASATLEQELAPLLPAAVQANGSTALLCTTTAGLNGAWSCASATELGNGDHQVRIEVVDAAGNASAPITITLTVDTAVPDEPEVTGPFNGDATDDPTPTFEGTAEPGSTVVVMDGTTPLCTAVVAQDGTWSCTPTTPLDSGSHAITITVTDPAGSTSAATDLLLTVGGDDLVAPTISPNVRTSNHMPVVEGTGTPGSEVTVVVDPDGDPATNDLVVFVVTVTANGSWSLNMGTATPVVGSMPQGGISAGSKFNVTLVASDTAGRVSPLARQELQIAHIRFFPIMWH